MKIYSVTHDCSVTYELLVEAEDENEAEERAHAYIGSSDWSDNEDIPDGSDHTVVYAKEFTPAPDTKIDIPASWSEEEEDTES
jgi:hypothetical protein